MGEMFSGAFLQNIGVDSEGRAHFYDPDNHKIIVSSEDVRGRNLSESEIVKEIKPPEWSTGVWDYLDFVTNEVEGLEWDEIDAPERPPEGI